MRRQTWKYILHSVILKIWIFRWSVLDLGVRSSMFPKDLISLFENEGVWRECLSKRQGGYLPIDQIHEQVKNLEPNNWIPLIVDFFIRPTTCHSNQQL